MKQLDILPALVFEDRMYPGEWRVDWTTEDGEHELAIFSGRNARERGAEIEPRTTTDRLRAVHEKFEREVPERRASSPAWVVKKDTAA